MRREQSIWFILMLARLLTVSHIFLIDMPSKLSGQSGPKTGWTARLKLVIVISSTRPCRMPVTNVVSLFINELEDRTEHTNSRSADNWWGEVTDRPDQCAAIPRDLNSLQKWANRNLTKFRKILNLYLWAKNRKHQHRLRGNWKGKQLCRKRPDPDGQQIEHESALYPWNKDQQSFRMH